MSQPEDWADQLLETFKMDIALAVLSLDLTAGKLAPMALSVPDEPAFRAALREGRRPSPPEAVTATLALLELRFGLPFAAYFRTWLHQVFLHPPRDEQAFRWYLVVLRGTREGAFELQTPPSLGLWLRVELTREELPEVSEIPETPWDHQILDDIQSRHPPDTRRPLPSPLAIVTNRIRYVAFLRAWQRAIARSPSPAEDIDELWAWGKREAKRMSMPPHLLERPDAWPALPEPPAG